MNCLFKICGSCKTEKPISCFYKHKKMLDGHLNFCKECIKLRNRVHRRLNAEKISAYERARSKTNKRKETIRNQVLKQRANHPEKYKARTAIGNALRNGLIIKEPCKVCGETKVEGHHEDYSKQLDVIWLCVKHHKQLHRKKGNINKPI